MDRATDAAARHFARTVARASDDQLLRVMRSPLRAVVLRTIFAVMPFRFDAEQAAKTRGVLEFRIGGRRRGRATQYQVSIADGRARIKRNGGADPSAVIEVGGPEFLQLAAGVASAPDLYSRGKLTIGGNLMTAVVMSALFRMPSR
ncbi:MAG: SCP2 sterol-binding domain-containing protein [Thermoleophilaceae bacterium]